MRNLRRFFALFLALVTVFAFAVTAAAEPAEELAYLNGVPMPPATGKSPLRLTRTFP